MELLAARSHMTGSCCPPVWACAWDRVWPTHLTRWGPCGRCCSPPSWARCRRWRQSSRWRRCRRAAHG